MARRYDSRTTTFSPEGRLYQVEYALEAINNGSLTIGILAKDGIVLAADRLSTSKLLEKGKRREKVFKIDDHAITAVAGLTADANILLEQARLSAQRYLYAYGEPQPLQNLIVNICDTKQSYTQFGGLRPFGVSFLFAGWDNKAGFQLFHSDPSGNFSGWKATAIGLNSSTAQSILQKNWHSDITLDEALNLAMRTLLCSIDAASPTADRLELAVLTFDKIKKDHIEEVSTCRSAYLTRKAESRQDNNITSTWFEDEAIDKLIKTEKDRKAAEQAAAEQAA